MPGIHTQNFIEILKGIGNIIASGLILLTDWIAKKISKGKKDDSQSH